MNFKPPFTSRRTQQIEQDEPQPTAFQVYGGWGPADDGRRLDPLESDREARAAGAVALAELYARRKAERESS